MHRLPCLCCCLALSLPAWAESQPPALVFAVRPVAAVSFSPSLDDGAALSAADDGGGSDAAASSRERRRAAREQLLSALGLDRFVPARNFNAFGREARVSLGLREDGTVSVRMRVKW